MRRLVHGAVASVVAISFVPVARAEPPPSNGPHRIEWTYPKFRAAEVTLTLGLFLTTTFIESRAFKAGDFVPDNGWHDGILFDDAARSLRARSAEGRHRAAQISNYLWNGTQYFPVVIDGLIAPLLFDRFNTEAALQMTLLNWEAQGIAFFLVRFGHRMIGRRRPSMQECANDPNYDPGCKGGYDRDASFPGGHSGMAFVGAGLTCAHHSALAVYGSDALGKAACILTLTTATATGVLRIVAEQHWASDILISAAIGLGAGIGVPYLLHYGPHLRRPGAFVSLLPWTDGRSGGGLALMGMH